MPRISRRLRLMLRLTLALLLVILLATGGIFLFLRSHAQELIAQYVHEAAVQSGLDITVGTATVTLLPLPALAVSDVHVFGKDWEFRVASATVLPHISLLSGTLRPYSLTLLRPHLTGTLPAPLAQIPPQSPSMEEAESAARPTEWLDGLSSLLPHSCRLHIVQGEADVHGTDNASLDLSGLNSDLHLTHGTDLSGRLVWDFASFTPPDGLTTRLDGLSLEGETSLRDPLHRTPDMTLKGRVQREDWLASLNVTLRATLDETQQRVSMDLGGALRKDGLLIPASVAGLATRQAENDDIRLEDMRLALGKDSGVFHGTLCLGGPDLFSLNGRLLFSRASLTQWLGFARNLPPGLQISLDALTEGVMDFSMDGKGLRVPHVEATASGSHFSGTGGVTSWAQPVVALNLTAPLVNLGQALPESTGTLPAAPQYGHEAFTPRPGRPVIPGELDVGYDIRLNADTVQYGPLAITDAHVVIKQGLVDTRTRLEDTVLLVQGKMYGGTVKGETVLGGSPETPYAIRVRAQNVDGEPLARALPVIPVTGGRLRGDVDILSQGKKLDLFLSKLRGSVTVHAEKGNVRATGKNALLAYKTLDLSFKARSGQWKQGRLGLDGQWKAVLADQGLDAQANLSGTLWFGGAGGQFAFQNLPGEFSCQLAPERSFKPSGLRIQASGAFGCQAAAGKLSLNNGTVSALGVEAKGSVNLSASKDGPIWQGKIALSVPDTAKTLQLAGATPRLPEACRRLELETAFKGTPTSLSLSELRTRIDQTDVQGNLALNWRKGLELQYSLSTPALDLDRYLPHGEHPKGPAAKAKSPPSQPWDLRFLKTFSAKGDVRAAKVTAWRLNIRNLHLDTTLDQGKLTLQTRQGSLYGAPLTVRAELLCDKGLQASTTLSAKGIDLGEASRDRGGDVVLGGRGTFRTDLKAHLTASGQLPDRLNGTWSFGVTNGFHQQRDRHGVLKGKPTHFETVGASGILMDGLAKSQNFVLKGEGLSITGGGWIHLGNDSLDCQFNVSKKNFPDFPLRLYGTLDSMKTSIGAGTLLLNTLGGIAGGVVDVLGGLLEGTWKLFR